MFVPSTEFIECDTLTTLDFQELCLVLNTNEARLEEFIGIAWNLFQVVVLAMVIVFLGKWFWRLIAP